MTGPASSEPQLDPVLGQIGALESRFDPKCHATASRLVDFMYGTPLTMEARCAENLRQKQFAGRLLEGARAKAKADGGGVTAGHVRAAFADWVEVGVDEEGHRDLKFATGVTLRVDKDDLRQYGSVAYALRAVLALQQEQWLTGKGLNVDAESVEAMKADGQVGAPRHQAGAHQPL